MLSLKYPILTYVVDLYNKEDVKRLLLKCQSYTRKNKRILLHAEYRN